MQWIARTMSVLCTALYTIHSALGALSPTTLRFIVHIILHERRVPTYGLFCSEFPPRQLLHRLCDACCYVCAEHPLCISAVSGFKKLIACTSFCAFGEWATRSEWNAYNALFVASKWQLEAKIQIRNSHIFDFDYYHLGTIGIFINQAMDFKHSLQCFNSDFKVLIQSMHCQFSFPKDSSCFDVDISWWLSDIYVLLIWPDMFWWFWQFWWFWWF